MFVKRNIRSGVIQVSLRQIADEFGVTRSKVNYLLQKFYAQNLLANTQQTPSKHPANTTTTDSQQVKTPQQTPSKHPANTQQTVEQRKHGFGMVLIPYIKQYGKVMIRHFFDYWTEKNENGTKMRFEKEKTFEVEKRLKRWSERDAGQLPVGMVLKNSEGKDYTKGLW